MCENLLFCNIAYDITSYNNLSGTYKTPLEEGAKYTKAQTLHFIYRGRNNNC
jgi:hypothetical protein